MERIKPGNKLTKADQKQVLSAHVHRYTGEHTPGWVMDANRQNNTGNIYELQFKDDTDWLNNTLFHVKKNGELDKRYNHCQSTPTWPNRNKTN